MSEERMNRRQLLKSLFKDSVDFSAKLVVKKAEQYLPPRRRPPGAISEVLFLSACTKCLDCVSACPHDAIFIMAPDLDLGSGTPFMIPEKKACHMCEGFPCVAACEPKALEMPSSPVWDLGTVHLREDLCFTFMGPECGACRDLCPETAPALHFIGNQPRIDEASCIGCGLCIEACPTIPKAIELLPLTDHKVVL